MHHHKTNCDFCHSFALLCCSSLVWFFNNSWALGLEVIRTGHFVPLLGRSREHALRAVIVGVKIKFHIRFVLLWIDFFVFLSHLLPRGFV